MTLRDWLPLAVFFPAMGTIIWLYLLASRWGCRQRDAALRAAAVTIMIPSAARACPHMAIIGVTSASCGLCGPLPLVQ